MTDVEKIEKQLIRALIVEDDEVDRMAVSRVLSQDAYPFDCDHAGTIGMVSALLEDNTYDIVLTDMNLPDSRELETIKTLLMLMPKTPIVVLSGAQDDAIALDAVREGAQDYIPKKYIDDGGLINRTLRHAIERHQLKMGLERIRDREHFLAHYDQCTSLPNRALFIDRIEKAVVHGSRNRARFSVFFIDLDRFKNVNDSIGHSAGDEVLRVVGERMKSVLCDGDIVSRFGGDEFALILQSCDIDSMEKVGRKLIDLINQPIHVGSRDCNVGASIGIACFPRHGATAEILLKNADIAMYEAKKNGRNQVQFFSAKLFEDKHHSFNLEQWMREALKQPDNHFTLGYQPRVELTTGKVRSVEALIRWNHSGFGLIAPDKFIPLAEDLGLIEEIDAWVFGQACQQISRWKSIDPDVCISVNISGRSFNSPDFVSGIIEPLLKKHDVNGSNLEMEITEGIFLSDTVQLHSRLKALKKLGLSLAIDDFGTGYSSLNYLNDFPIDTLKIDGSFICDESSSHKKKTLLRAIITLGEALGMTVVAECIESESQRKYLKSLGCEEGQGFYWGKASIDWVPDKPKEHFIKSKFL